MSDSVLQELMLAQFRQLRADLAELKADSIEVKERIGLLESGVASISRRVDRMSGDIGQIKRRLQLVDDAA